MTARSVFCRASTATAQCCAIGGSVQQVEQTRSGLPKGPRGQAVHLFLRSIEHELYFEVEICSWEV